MPYADPAAQRAWAKNYRPPDFQAYLEYQREYAARNWKSVQQRAAEWKRKNKARIKAHSRLLYLRRKENPTESEIIECFKICMKFPKKRIVCDRQRL